MKKNKYGQPQESKIEGPLTSSKIADFVSSFTGETVLDHKGKNGRVLVQFENQEIASQVAIWWSEEMPLPLFCNGTHPRNKTIIILTRPS